MAGFGQTAMGLKPFGFGTPVAAPAAASGSWGVRWLDPVSRNFEIDPTTGQYKQMPEIRHRVFLMLAETFGSSTVRPTDGLKRPEKMGDGFERLQEAAVRRALFQLTDVENLIRIDAVIVTRVNNQRAHTIVQWTDLTTEEPDGLEFQG